MPENIHNNTVNSNTCHPTSDTRDDAIFRRLYQDCHNNLHKAVTYTTSQNVNLKLNESVSINGGQLSENFI